MNEINRPFDLWLFFHYQIHTNRCSEHIQFNILRRLSVNDLELMTFYRCSQKTGLERLNDEIININIDDALNIQFFSLALALSLSLLILLFGSHSILNTQHEWNTRSAWWRHVQSQPLLTYCASIYGILHFIYVNSCVCDCERVSRRTNQANKLMTHETES